MSNYQHQSPLFIEETWFYGSKSRNSSTQDLSSQSQGKASLESPFSTLHVSASAPDFSNLRRGSVPAAPAPAAPSAQPKPPRSRHIRRAASADERDPDGNPLRPSSARPPRPDAPGRTSVRSNNAQQRSTVFSERRKAWRARLEAVTAGSRLYSVPVPAKPATRALSVQSTPSGSPRPPSALGTDDTPSPGSHTSSYSNLGQGAAYSHAVPAVWVGHAADQAPQDFSQLSDAALMLFLQQAGVQSVTLAQEGAEEQHAALVTAAQAAKGAWEVERICVGCFDAEDILRVPRGSDIAVLKQAWKKLAMHVHPDKCSAEGAAIAMAIAKDAYEMLLLRAEAAVVAKEMNNNSTTNAAAAGGGSNGVKSTPHGDIAEHSTRGDGASTQTNPLSGLSCSAAAGDSAEQKKASAVPPLPTKVRVKIKAVNKKNEMNQ